VGLHLSAHFFTQGENMGMFANGHSRNWRDRWGGRGRRWRRWRRGGRGGRESGGRGRLCFGGGRGRGDRRCRDWLRRGLAALGLRGRVAVDWGGEAPPVRRCCAGG
jgi:hypothetical protein